MARLSHIVRPRQVFIMKRLLFYRAALPLSGKALTFVAGSSAGAPGSSPKAIHTLEIHAA